MQSVILRGQTKMESEGGSKAYLVDGAREAVRYGKMSERCSDREEGTGSQGQGVEVWKFEGS
jgi:hypothetical protein